MSKGYVGAQSKRRTRNIYFFLIFFILIVFFLYIFIREENLNESNNNIVTIEKDSFYKDQSLQLTELKTKIIEYDQKLQLRNQLIKSLKDQIKNLEKNNNILKKNIKDLEMNNNELLSSIELQSIKNKELNNSQKTIKVLKEKAEKQNTKLLLFEEKNIELNNQIQILNETINTIVFQKNEISKKMKNLQYHIIEKEKIIENLKDKIHH